MRQTQLFWSRIFKGDSPLMVLLRDYETAVEQAATEPDNKKLQKHLLDLQQQMDDKYAWQLESEAKAVLTQLGITNLQQQMGELSGGHAAVWPWPVCWCVRRTC